MSRNSTFMLLTFNKALFLSMCVRFPCVHTVESHDEIAHSECLSIFLANYTKVHYPVKVTSKYLKY